jgi:hypothetical protein
MTNLNEDGKLETGDSRCCHRGRFWKFPLIVAAVILIKAGIVLLLWNALIPDLFHGPVLTYLQALGLTVLAKLLFGFAGFRHFAGRHGGPPWKARWAGLSPEEREKLREDIRKKFGENPST